MLKAPTARGSCAIVKDTNHEYNVAEYGKTAQLIEVSIFSTAGV